MSTGSCPEDHPVLSHNSLAVCCKVLTVYSFKEDSPKWGLTALLRVDSYILPRSLSMCSNSETGSVTLSADEAAPV